MGIKPAENNKLDTEVVVALKQWSVFYKSHDFSSLSSKMELDLLWSRNCISEISRTARVAVSSPNPN